MRNGPRTRLTVVRDSQFSKGGTLADDVTDPGHVALALLDYRVGEVEKRVETMDKGLIELDRKVNDIPGFIARKFDEQRVELARNRKTSWDRIIQIGTLAAAVIAAAATYLTHGAHP
jgi:hypothetical protein